MDDTGPDPSYPRANNFYVGYRIIYRCVAAPQADASVSPLYLPAQVMLEVSTKLGARTCASAICVCVY